MFESEPRVTERGSPSLVGRGIANPMSERTRGFELPSCFFSLRRMRRSRENESPTPRAFLVVTIIVVAAASGHAESNSSHTRNDIILLYQKRQLAIIEVFNLFS